MPIQKYVYDHDTVLQVTDGLGVTQTEYTSTAEGYGDLLSEFDGAATKYYEPDALGSTDALIGDTQVVTDRWKYQGFGATAHTTGTSTTPFTWVGRAGYQQDSEIGLYCLRARYYDTATAGFLTKNSIGLMGGDPNLYRYVANSPVNMTSPSGLVLSIPTVYTDSGNDARIFKLLINSAVAHRGFPGISSRIYRADMSPHPAPPNSSTLCACLQLDEPTPPPKPKAGKPAPNRRKDSECCRDAFNDFSIWMGHWAGVVCCDGRRIICDWSPFASDTTFPGGIFHHCVVAHEFHHLRYHVEECKATIPNLNRSYWKKGIFDTARAECDAYEAQFKCLDRHSRACEAFATEQEKAECRRKWFQHQNTLRRNANLQYGCGFVLFPEYLE